MIPFYESPEWRGCRRQPCLLNGQLVLAYKNKTLPGWPKKADHNVTQDCSLNGHSVLAILTNGMGRGKVDRHYVYIDIDGVQYFIHTGDEWPPVLVIEVLGETV